MATDEPYIDDEIIECWCGAKGTYDELFDSECFESGCGGTGMIQCECGGDFCVCHNHGEIECPGCEDCEGDDDSDLYDGPWDDDE